MHILLIVRAAHRLPAAVDDQGADALELLDQTNRVILVVVKGFYQFAKLESVVLEILRLQLP